jgi:hypothetical protein
MMSCTSIHQVGLAELIHVTQALQRWVVDYLHLAVCQTN